MEEQPMCEDEEADITEEKIVAAIFIECDPEGIGKVPVSKLIEFMSSKADQKLESSVLEDLRLMLDPEQSNVDVTRQTFDAVMMSWAQKMNINNNNISCPEDPDPCHDDTESAPISDDDWASPSSDSLHYRSCELHNLSYQSSYSCGGSEAVASPHTIDPNSLAERVMELKHTIKRLETHNEDLQNQLHASDENYTQLQRDYENICHKVSSMKTTVQKCDQLQKESEELKEAVVAAEANNVNLRSKVQQFEREAQALQQQVTVLENQKMELVLQLEMSEKKNKETQALVTELKTEIEKLLKQCSFHEHQNEQRSAHILGLEGQVDDLLSNIQHLQGEKQSLEVHLLDVEDEFLSVHSQSSLCLANRGTDVETLVGNDIDPKSLWNFQRVESEKESQNLKIEFLQDQYQESLRELKRLKEQGYSAELNTPSPSVPHILQTGLSSGEVDSSTSHSNMSDKEVQCLWSNELRSQECQTMSGAGNMRSIITQTDPDCPMNLEEEPRRKKQRTLCPIAVVEEASTPPSTPASNFMQLEVGNFNLFRPDTELVQWVCDTDVLIAERRKTNLQTRPGGICDVEHNIMERPTVLVADVIPALSPILQRASSVDCGKGAPALVTSTPENTTSMRRCMSESQVVGVEGSVSSVSSETSSSSTSPPDVFPSLPDVVLQQLGLSTAAAAAAASRPCDVLSDQDIENRFSALSLAFKTDKLTLVSRHDRQQRQRDQAERNMAAEVLKLKTAVHNLNYLCKDSESIEILGKIQDQVDVLQRSTERVSSSAEIFGAVQQESRVSKAIEVMLTHVENLKRMYEKEHAELEETKRVLLENNLVVDGSTDSPDAIQRNPRHRIVNSLSGQGKQRRRASIAVFRPLGSPDSTKTSSNSLTFGDTKRGAPHSRRTSSTHLESPSPGWDRTDRLDRPEVVVGSMDDIKEIAEGRRESSVDLEEQSTTVEENNNCMGTASRKSSRCDSLPEVEGENVSSSFGDADKNPALCGDPKDDSAKDSDCSPPSLIRNLDSLRTFRDSATEFICQTHTALVDCVMPLNVDYVLIQTRRCATLLLLFAALWSLVSTFVPTTAQSRDCVPFSWLTLEELLRPYTQLRHYGPPPT